MDKINFKNLPNKTTPINAENLNKIQENMEKAINEKSSLPVGGDEGQILAKASNQDNDVEWIDNIGQGGGDTLPIGAILPFSGDVIPNGWLLCDGSVIEQEDYPELFEVLAGNYGIISREKIRLPDLRGKVTVGKDSTDADFDTLGNTGGEKTHNLTIDELPLDSFNSTGNSSGSGTFVGVSSPVPHNNLQPYIVTNYIIKAKMTVAIEGEIIQENDTATTENVYSATAINEKIKTNIVTGQEFETGRIIDEKKEFGKKFTYENISGVKNYDFDTTNISEFTHMEGFCTTSTGDKYPLFSFNPYASGNGLEPISSTLFCAWIEGSKLVVLAKKTTLTKANIYIYYTKN